MRLELLVHLVIMMLLSLRMVRPAWGCYMRMVVVDVYGVLILVNGMLVVRVVLSYWLTLVMMGRVVLLVLI